MRFPVSQVLELLSAGMTANEIIEDHPLLEMDDIAASLLYASLKMSSITIIHAA